MGKVRHHWFLGDSPWTVNIQNAEMSVWPKRGTGAQWRPHCQLHPACSYSAWPTESQRGLAKAAPVCLWESYSLWHSHCSKEGFLLDTRQLPHFHTESKTSEPLSVIQVPLRETQNTWVSLTCSNSLPGLVPRKHLVLRPPFRGKNLHTVVCFSMLCSSSSFPLWKQSIRTAHQQREHLLQSVGGTKWIAQFTRLLMRAVCSIPHALSRSSGILFNSGEKT